MTTNNDDFPFPHVLRIEPASQCNLSCSHCPTGTVDMERTVMSETVFEKVLAEIELHKNQIKVIVLYHGGEPLLNKHFYSMVARIKEINPDFFLKTVSNGMALTLKHAKHVIDSGIDVIEFSLDGDSAQESQHIRVQSNTDKIVSNIKALIDLKAQLKMSKPDIYVSTTQFLRDKTQEDIPSEAPVPTWLRDTFKDEVAGYKSTYALQWPHMGDTGEYDFLRTEGDDGDECDHVVSTLTVRADGSIVPCCYDLTNKLEMGNILDQKLMEIWNGKKYRILRAAIESKKHISICKKCAVVKPPVYLIPKWSQKIVAI